MKNSRILIDRLRARLAQAKVSEAEFAVAIAEIVASAPEKIEGRDGLLLSREIRALKEEWRASLQQPPS